MARFVNAPLRRLLPAPLATVATFVVSGAIHDLAVRLVTGSRSLLFAVSFGLLGLEVVVSSWVGLDYRRRPWALRACINLGLVMTPPAMVVAGGSSLGLG